MTDILDDVKTETDLERIENKLDILLHVATSLTDMVISLTVAHNDTVNKVNAGLEQLAPHLETIGPTIDQVMRHPLFRMLGAGK